ncbi:MAG: hypothetical protein IT181_21390 [Acidobacteria bacterium]|nr:hypothetical protein [Acidobacteriota bacterium]
MNVVTIAGPCCTDQGNDLAVDTEGSILAAGRRGSLDLDRDETIDVKTWGSPDPLVSKATLTGKINTGWPLGLGGPKDKGLHDGFLVRYDRAGAPLWSRAIGGAGRDVLTGVTTDSDGNAIFVGIVKGAVDVDRNGTIDVTGNADGTAGIASFGPAGRFQSTPSNARLDAEGQVMWIKAVSGSGLQTVGSLAVAGNSDLLVLGGYTAAADTNGAGDLEFKSMGTRKPRNQLDGNGFLLRVSPSGKPIWARREMAGADHGLEGFVAILDERGEVQQTLTVVCGDSDVVNAAAFTADCQYPYFKGFTRLRADYEGGGTIERASAGHLLGDLDLAISTTAD